MDEEIFFSKAGRQEINVFAKEQKIKSISYQIGKYHISNSNGRIIGNFKKVNVKPDQNNNIQKFAHGELGGFLLSRKRAKGIATTASMNMMRTNQMIKFSCPEYPWHTQWDQPKQ